MILARMDDRLLSPCHSAPQQVQLGPITFNPNDRSDWSQRIDHYCSMCGERFDPKDGSPGPGKLWRERHPQSSPEAT